MRDRNSMIKGIMGALLLAPCAATLAAEAPCCASGDNGRPNAIMARSLTDLGQPNPAVTNESRQSDYQAFVFTRDTQRFIEIADASGTPRAAFTVVNGTLLSLPVGSDAVQQVPVAPTAADTVYDDHYVSVGIRRGSDGRASWQVYIK